jgi:hypothetical protein
MQRWLALPVRSFRKFSFISNGTAPIITGPSP